jgi:hypothetical protein
VEYSNEPVMVEGRVVELEKQLVLLQETSLMLSEQIKETQRYLIKLAHNQSEIAKRVSTWPFIAVDTRDEN